MNDSFVHRFHADNGLLIRLRPLQADDVACLLDLFEHLSPQSRYLRFNVPLADPDPALVRREAQRLAEIDPDEGMAWLALADLPDQPNACVGGIRCIYQDDETAEMAVTVRDDLQGLGIGSELLRFAGNGAHQRGVRRIVAVFQSGNRGVWRSLKNLGVPYRRQLEGPEAQIEVDLEEALRHLGGRKRPNHLPLADRD